MARYWGRSRQGSYELGSLIKGGGEGTVYNVQGRPALVAKIYKDDRLADREFRDRAEGKILAMLDIRFDSFYQGRRIVAWPEDALYDDSGRFCGFVMPKIENMKSLIWAIRPSDRDVLWPNGYHLEYSVAIAFNLALTIELLHQAGVIVGDLNTGNIMIDAKGNVVLVDADSFNIITKNGREYRCVVGFPEALPPELQGKDFSQPTARFTQKTDCFSLAIHIFCLLCNNCHPFGCLDYSTVHGSSSAPKLMGNIVKGYCPYVTGASGNTAEDALNMNIYPAEIRALIDRAFKYTAATAVRQSTIDNRPTAHEWRVALGNLYNAGFKACSKNPLHRYPASYSGECPWCAIERRKQASASQQQAYTPPQPARQDDRRYTPPQPAKPQVVPPVHKPQPTPKPTQPNNLQQTSQNTAPNPAPAPELDKPGWHKFLIRFDLWACAFIWAVACIGCMLRGGNYPNNFPETFGKKEWLYTASVFFYLVMWISALDTRSRLVDFIKDAPKKLRSFLVFNFLASLLLGFLNLTSPAPAPVSMAALVGGNAAVLIISLCYYANPSRRALFIQPPPSKETPPKPPVYPEVRNLGWHKFLIYFVLWACVFIWLIVSVVGIAIWGIAPFRDRFTGENLYMGVIGLVGLVLGSFGVHVRYQLADFRKNAPKKLFLFLAVNSLLWLWLFIRIDILENPTPGSLDDPARALLVCGNAAVLIISWRYYAKRKELFIF